MKNGGTGRGGGSRLSIAKTASGLSLDRNLSRTLPASLVPRSGTSPGNTLLNMPKSTLDHRRAAAASLNRQARGDGAGRGGVPLAAPIRHEAGVSCSAGTDTEGPEDSAATNSGRDIFGMRVSDVDDGCEPEDGAGGFWMPGASLPTPPQTSQPKPRPAPGPKEFFDGYNLWHEWESRTAGKPFWYCKETGETRWEKPTMAAVQEADKRPAMGMGSGTEDPGNLLDGTFDESANRRAFLQALYEWRNGGASAGTDNDTASQDRIPQERQQPQPRPQPVKKQMVPNPALKNASKLEKGFGKPLVPKKTQQKQEVSKTHDQDAQQASRAPASRPATGNSSQVRPLSAHLTKVGGSKAPQSATLHAAAGRGGVTLMKEIIAARADVNALDRFGSTALHYAAGGGHAEAVRLLLSHGASSEARSMDEDTPLHAAAKSGNTATVRVLLEHGASKVAINSRANTPHKLAVMFGKADVAQLLLEESTSSDIAGTEEKPVRDSSGSGAGRRALQSSPAAASGGISTDTADLAAGGGGGKVLQPRKWGGAPECKEPEATGHSMACGSSTSSDAPGDQVDASPPRSNYETLPPAQTKDLLDCEAHGSDEEERSSSIESSDEDIQRPSAMHGALGHSGVGANAGACAGGCVEEEVERRAARALLEELRMRAKVEADHVVEEHFSRPGTARSRPEGALSSAGE